MTKVERNEMAPYIKIPIDPEKDQKIEEYFNNIKVKTRVVYRTPKIPPPDEDA